MIKPKKFEGISGIGFCFPGVKTNKKGNVVKNGPRIPELCNELNLENTNQNFQ